MRPMSPICRALAAEGAYNIGRVAYRRRQVIEWLAERFGARELVHFGARPCKTTSVASRMVKVERPRL
jgi:hypothetical protein